MRQNFSVFPQQTNQLAANKLRPNLSAHSVQRLDFCDDDTKRNYLQMPLLFCFIILIVENKYRISVNLSKTEVTDDRIILPRRSWESLSKEVDKAEAC